MFNSTGSTIVKFFGTLVRWIAVGFRKSFKDLWDGPENFEHSLDYAFATKMLGFGFILFIGFILSNLRC